MIHLITIVGRSAKDFYLEQGLIPDFKSLLRTVTSGRVMMISTKFRSDLFYGSEVPKTDEVIKLWALYAKTERAGLNKSDMNASSGDEQTLSWYFNSINMLSANWYYYSLYKKAFQNLFNHEPQNPVARTVIECDQYLVAHTSTKRKPLIKVSQVSKTKLNSDTLSLAMRIIKNDDHSN